MNKNSDDSFAIFGKHFQEILSFLIISDKIFADRILEVLRAEFFEQDYLQTLTRFVRNYRLKYRTHPTIPAIRAIANSELEAQDAQKGQIFALLDKYLTEEVIPDREYVQDASLEFCRKQSLHGALVKSIEHLRRRSYDEIIREVLDAVRLGDDAAIGLKYIEDFDVRYIVEEGERISSGFLEFDKITRGGMKRGAIGVLIGSTGVGKSQVLVNIGAAAIKKGYNVLYYTLELDAQEVDWRFDATITGIPLDLLVYNKDIVKQELDKFKLGQLITREYPMKTVSIQTLRGHYEKILRLGTPIDVIIVDYGDLLLPAHFNKERRFELESIFEDLKAWAKECSVAFWTATQTNRGGVNAELVTLSEISEAYNKCFCADFIFTLSRTIQDRQANGGRFFIAKSRLGPDGIIFPIKMDTSRAYVEVLPQEALILEDEQQPENFEDRWRQRYQKN